MVEISELFLFPLTEKEIEKICNSLLKYLFIKKKTYINLRIINDNDIKKLNLLKRGKDRTTDVLSFPELELPLPILYLGEVVISYETLETQAVQIGNSKIDEFLRLLVHGVLHLIGFDHEISNEEEVRMQKKEDECLDFLYKKYEKSFIKYKNF